MNSYLTNIDRQAQEQFDTIIQQMAEAQGITEALKATNQMIWVGRMNNIRSAAMKIIDKEIVYK